MSYTDNALSKINEVNILSNNDLENLTKIKDELQRCFEKKQYWRSEVEAKCSVLNSVIHPTPSARYWQSVREQNVMYHELLKLAIDFQEESANMELYKLEYDEIDQTSKKGIAKAKIKDAEIKRSEFQLIEMKLAAKDRTREILMWEKIKNELTASNIIDTENFDAHHLESYKLRWEKEMNIATKTNNATVYKNSLSNLETLLDDYNEELTKNG